MAAKITTAGKVPPHFCCNYGNHGDVDLNKLQRRFDKNEIAEQLADLAEEKGEKG